MYEHTCTHSGAEYFVSCFTVQRNLRIVEWSFLLSLKRSLFAKKINICLCLGHKRVHEYIFDIMRISKNLFPFDFTSLESFLYLST